MKTYVYEIVDRIFALSSSLNPSTEINSDFYLRLIKINQLQNLILIKILEAHPKINEMQVEHNYDIKGR